MTGFIYRRVEMTIKELCEKYDPCDHCPFFKACPFCDVNIELYLSKENNEAITKSIIETAEILKREEVY